MPTQPQNHMKKIQIFALFVSLFCVSLQTIVYAQKGTTQVIAIYENCTVYAGSTEYAFKNAKTNEPITFSVLSIPEKGIKIPKVPKNLIESTKNIEGVPGANPAQVGKKFKLTYNQEGELLSVMPHKK